MRSAACAAAADTARGSATRGCTTNRPEATAPAVRWHQQVTRTPNRTRHRQALGDLRRQIFGDLYQQPVPPRAVRRERLSPSGWRASRAAPACGSNPLLPPRARQYPEPGERVSARPNGSPHRLPALARITGSSRSGQGASSSVRPRPATAYAGPWRLPGQSRPRAHLAGQRLGRTGHGPDSCPCRQPGATGSRASRMFLITCYGLTSRCREVKR
jgi:hypothetical protein